MAIASAACPEPSDRWQNVDVVRDRLPPAWRKHARHVHLELIRRWLPTLGGVWLKTDLFEELSAERRLLPLDSAHWIGADISQRVVTRARRYGLTAAVCDVRRLPFASSSLSGVLSTSTLDHFPTADHIESALVELRRVLATGGVLLLTLDNPQNPLIWLRNALPPRIVDATGLAPFFVGATLSEGAGRSMLERVGFSVEEVAFVLHTPHIVGTRSARFKWFARYGLPLFERLGRTRFRRYSGHYVAFLCRRG